MFSLDIAFSAEDAEQDFLPAAAAAASTGALHHYQLIIPAIATPLYIKGSPTAHTAISGCAPILPTILTG
jgi:hypothetical protein